MTQDDQGPLALLSDMKPNPIGLHITKGNSLIVRRRARGPANDVEKQQECQR